MTNSIEKQLVTMSAVALDKLALTASRLAEQLRAEQPTKELALAAGVKDLSYSTVRYGTIASYRGEAIVTMTDGTKWKCVGHPPKGNAHVVTDDGYIEFIPIKDE